MEKFELNKSQEDKELIAALWSLSQDAAYAYKQLLEGDQSGLDIVGTTIKRVEKAVISKDVKSGT